MSDSEKCLTNYDEFYEKVGLITDLEELADKGAPVPFYDNGLYEIWQLKELQEFCGINVIYHIVTQKSYGRGMTLENFASYDNRLGYLLASGSQDDELWFDSEPETPFNIVQESNEKIVVYEPLEDAQNLRLDSVKDIRKWLNSNKLPEDLNNSIRQKLEEFIKAQQFDQIELKESGEAPPLGLILDIFLEGECLETETWWFDDFQELE